MNFREAHDAAVAAVSSKLAALGWRTVDEVAPGSVQPDLVASNSEGDLLCLELKLGDRPLHSQTLSQLLRMRDDLSSSWPGRATVALVTSQPISGRLKAAMLTSGIVLIEVASSEEAAVRVADLSDTLTDVAVRESGDAVAGLMTKAAIAIERGNWKEAEAVYRALLNRQTVALGTLHPYVLEASYRLALLMGDMGDLGGARALYEQLLADQQRVLGSEHPNTLATRYNLAGLMRDMGDLGGARALYEQLLADQQRVLGSEHPNTLATRYNLAGLMRDMGDLGGARALYEPPQVWCRFLLS
ncbi:tetratricopeptide repeat protein [Propioniciclava sp. MC1683]|uniref:tetratricopeptide repeat protein n=1 Tax=Propioniciclava sp. MC1683 TaxID=2760309 RepID=UPI0015FFE3F4|nr:tetratricopeptide repeat protein [Propioniciclava sp. MC1683]